MNGTAPLKDLADETLLGSSRPVPSDLGPADQSQIGVTEELFRLVAPSFPQLKPDPLTAGTRGRVGSRGRLESKRASPRLLTIGDGPMPSQRERHNFPGDQHEATSTRY